MSSSKRLRNKKQYNLSFQGSDSLSKLQSALNPDVFNYETAN